MSFRDFGTASESCNRNGNGWFVMNQICKCTTVFERRQNDVMHAYEGSPNIKYNFIYVVSFLHSSFPFTLLFPTPVSF
jgi:hypothetical protein